MFGGFRLELQYESVMYQFHQDDVQCIHEVRKLLLNWQSVDSSESLMQKLQIESYTQKFWVKTIHLFWGILFRGEREFPFPTIPGNTSLPFPFPKVGNGFFIPIPAPKSWEWNSSFLFPFPIVGNAILHSRSIPGNGSGINYQFETDTKIRTLFLNRIFCGL